MSEAPVLPRFGQKRKDTIANVSWPMAEQMSAKDIEAARTALVIYMRKNHPGKKYRVLREWDGETDSLIAVPLDG